MTPMVGSATSLPVPDKSFDVVLASDMLEHVPPTLRRQVIGEALRVARRLVIFGFPCGRLPMTGTRR
ncbi:class I SAM-dependent methyltransferase [Granulicella sp. L60]|uniref:class I SAM-dependent methyltransferase n=1 Tax=Granulicella sp. L60 TaxID=1641866 RepID=UPI00131DB04D|nr:class I SAM-dependent methyltransferase [Granulicella sp. L60]